MKNAIKILLLATVACNKPQETDLIKSNIEFSYTAIDDSKSYVYVSTYHNGEYKPYYYSQLNGDALNSGEIKYIENCDSLLIAVANVPNAHAILKINGTTVKDTIGNNIVLKWQF